VSNNGAKRHAWATVNKYRVCIARDRASSSTAARVITVTGKAFYDIAHAPADHSNRRRGPKDYAVSEIHPVFLCCWR
jgi:hypothetical protein